MKKKLIILFNKFVSYLTYFYLKYDHFSMHQSTYLYERPIEYAFALSNLANNHSLDVLDVGTGINSFASTLQHCGFNVTASDFMERGNYWDFFQNRHIYVYNDDITNSKFSTESFGAITCISTIEHIEDYHSALGEMVRILKRNGMLILSFPYSHDKFCENVYALQSSDSLSKTFKYIARSYCDAQIKEWCNEFNLEVTEKKYIRGWTGKFWRSGSRITFPYEVKSKEVANCLCLSLKKVSRKN